MNPVGWAMPVIQAMPVTAVLSATSVIAGYLLDGMVGDPRWFPHPVRGIGWLIVQGEHYLNRGSTGIRFVAGSLLAIGVIGIAAGVAWAVVAVAGLFHPLAAHLVTALGVGLLLARRSLTEEAGEAVHRPLAAGDLLVARKALSGVVGRDTEALDESEIARASVETLAENASDGVIAPLVFAVVGGLPAIAIYKAINTLDSMIGHKDERYRYFGCAGARIDDLANWVPARLTMLALVTAAALSGRNASGALRVAFADAGKHKSPNAGWPEAAMAGALGVRLGGRQSYDGEPSSTALLNPSGRPPASADLLAAILLVERACCLVLICGTLVWLVFHL